MQSRDVHGNGIPNGNGNPTGMGIKHSNGNGRKPGQWEWELPALPWEYILLIAANGHLLMF